MLRVANTEYGKVKGAPAADPRITAFLGVPYAAAASGALRWRAPQSHAPWDGVRECYVYGDSPMQRKPGVGANVNAQEWHVDPDLPMSEDCLNLNIWTPAMTGDEKFPVMVYLYGGASLWGYTAQMELDGERLARRGLVVVTVNYRVNIFGYFAHPELTAECGEDYCTNFGYLDQQAALAWVHRNIANFGGDPDNVTLFGQSAGAGSTIAQLVSPTTDPKTIHRAIIQSGGGMSYGVKSRFQYTLKDAEAEGVRFLEHIGCKSLAEARAIDAETLRDLVFANLNDFRFAPCIDGKFLVEDATVSFAENRWLRVPIMIGNTSKDTDFGSGYITGRTPDEFKASIEKNYPEIAEKLLELVDYDSYDIDEMRKNCKAQAAFFAQQLLALRVADDGLASYVYLFDGDMPGDNQGAFHSSELWFMFETLAKCWRPFVGKHYDLARKMCNYWANFAKTGDPNGLDIDSAPMPVWEKYTDANRRAMEFRFELEMTKKDETPAFTAMFNYAADKLWRNKDEKNC